MMTSRLRSSSRWDRPLILAAVMLTLISLVAMSSATVKLNPFLTLRHMMWIAGGMCCALGIAGMDYRRWIDMAGIGYWAALAALALVLAVGTTRLGATRWLSVCGVSLQPSEFAKLTAACLLARHLAGQPVPLPGRAIWTSLVLAGLPALLVFLQPDLGSASVFVAMWVGVVWAAGISRKALLGLSSVLLALMPVGWHILKDYQRDRLLAFVNPHADPLGVGYTIIQSTIAIGAGQLWGRGWFAGTQNQLSFLPERHSDFIFSVIGEEWGLLGCLTVIGLFGILLGRMIHIAVSTSDPQGRLLAIGICSWVAYQGFVNMGMVMGLLPVVGVPLPLVSYGGTAMVTMWVAVGLLTSISRSHLVR